MSEVSAEDERRQAKTRAWLEEMRSRSEPPIQKLFDDIEAAINALAAYLESIEWQCGCGAKIPPEEDYCLNCRRLRPRVKRILEDYRGIHLERGISWVKEREPKRLVDEDGKALGPLFAVF